jgi:hypothetical protein
MKSLIELGKEIKEREDCLEKIKQVFQTLHLKKLSLISDQESVERELYQKRIHLTHIKEIYRLAKIQFSRFRGLPEPTLTEADVRELDKWVGRAKSADGLVDIINALMELNKYQPSEIKSNLYALVQKIIIGGAYNQGKKKL